MRRYLLALSLLVAPAVATAAGAAPRVVAKIRVGSQPCAGVAAFGSFFETNYGSATLSRVNPRTNKVTKTGNLGSQPCGIAAGAGSLWIDGYGTSRVERVNRKTLKVSRRIKVGANVWDVAFAFGSVWATNNFDGSVVRIDPSTNRIVKTIKTGAQPTNFAIAGDALWVGNNAMSGVSTQDVYRIDPATNTFKAFDVGHTRPSGIIVSADAVWVANGDDTVVRLDPASGSVAATVKVGQTPQQGDLAPDGTVWIPNQLGDSISVIDSQTNAVARTMKLTKGTAPFVLRHGFGDLWVGSFGAQLLWRIRP
jgi:YVTN family beta-propeller protein